MVRTMADFNLKLKWAKMLTPRVKHFAFEWLDPISPFTFVPGQFIRLSVPSKASEKIITRSYSLANNHADEPGTLQFAASYVDGGAASEYLFSLEPGAIVEAGGPFGRLILKEEDQPERYILVSTNTGVTPYRALFSAMIPRFKATPKLKIHLIQGLRTSEDLFYLDDFIAFQNLYPDNFSFTICYSQVKEALTHPFERAGRVQKQLEDLNCTPGKDIVYLCGNPNMVDEVFTMLKERGFEIKNIRREKYIS